MTRAAGAHGLVLRRRGASSRIARNHAGDTLHVLEHGVYAPEAASRQNGGLLALSRGGLGLTSKGWKLSMDRCCTSYRAQQRDQKEPTAEGRKPIRTTMPHQITS